MIWVIALGIVTVISVIMGVKKKKAVFLLVPFVSIFAFMLVKIIMVPLPFTDTVRFIFSLRG
ncbi:hypothetical protein EEX84_02950 [Planococcus salinus]|uniref:Uncharacterized protein n=1 Tax=Planococcus salinus TaxID=1848460 RepID=A0A3M8P9N6_9BACL|nr:hypothetical protein EEX84_02950 [Planococcus salinus]